MASLNTFLLNECYPTSSGEISFSPFQLPLYIAQLIKKNIKYIFFFPVVVPSSSDMPDCFLATQAKLQVAWETHLGIHLPLSVCKLTSHTDYSEYTGLLFSLIPDSSSTAQQPQTQTRPLPYTGTTDKQVKGPVLQESPEPKFETSFLWLWSLH